MATRYKTCNHFRTTEAWQIQIPTGALLLVSDQPMTPDGVKTDESDR